MTATIPPPRRVSAPLDGRVALILTRHFAEHVSTARWVPVADAAARDLQALLPPPLPAASYLPEPLMQVLSGMAQGLSTLDMASQLGVRAEAVRARTTVLFDYLGVHERAHAVSVAYQRGILGGAR